MTAACHRIAGLRTNARVSSLPPPSITNCRGRPAMTRRDALIALRDAVVKEQQDAMAAAAKNALPGRPYVMSVRAFDHHIADAIDLVDEVLCGWHWSVSWARSGPGATVWHEPDKCTAVYHGKGRSPARALLLAILEALIAREGGDG